MIRNVVLGRVHPGADAEHNRLRREHVAVLSSEIGRLQLVC